MRRRRGRVQWIVGAVLVVGGVIGGCGDDPCDKTCPDCGTLVGSAPPAGTDLHCEKDGINHGPSRTWYGDGTLRRQGGYDSGQKCGEWTDWLPNGQVAANDEFESCHWSQRYWSGPFGEE